jgi:3-oxoadipate enol-lactonase
MSESVVLCGLLGSTSLIWDAQLPALRGRRVVQVDYPGHGDAPLAEVGDVAELATRVLDAVGDGTFSFVGLSLGGAVGMQLALTVPDRLERLVLACTATRFGEPEQWYERAATVRAEGTDAIADAALERWFTPAFERVEVYRAMLLGIDPEGYARCCEALARWDVRGQLGGVRAPVLAIAAAGDPSTPPAELERIAAEIPGARLEVIGRAAHAANVERADEFNRLIEEHL